MSKEKAPAYQRYPADYLSDVNVMAMTLEEEGMYNRLMDYCWREIALPTDVTELAALCKGIEPTTKVLKCFTLIDGLYHHKRLDEERKKQSEFHEMKSRAAQKGNEARWGKSKNKNKIITSGSQRHRRGIAAAIANDRSSSSSSSSFASSSSISSAAAERKKRSRSAPEDFAISSELKEWACKERPDLNVDLEIEKFRDYEFKDPKSDWEKTFRNWIRNARGGNNGTEPKTPARNREQAAKNIYQQLLREQSANKSKS